MTAGLQLSYFEADVTPPMGTPLNSGQSPPARQIVDPLTARGVVLRYERGRPIVLCSVDWSGIANESHIAWREAMAEAAGTRPEHVMLHCVHQMNAPFGDMTAERMLLGRSSDETAFDSNFEADVIKNVAAAIARSEANARHITHLGVGEADVQNVASNRRILGGNGRVRAVRHNVCEDALIRDMPEGVIDESVRVVTFYEHDTPIVSMSFYACHARTNPMSGQVSTDYVGMARSICEARHPDLHHIHFCGAAGNITTGKFNTGEPDVPLVLGQRLARGIERASRSQDRHILDPNQLQMFEERIQLPPAKDLNEEQLWAKLADETVSHAEHARAARELAWVIRCERGSKLQFTSIELGPAQIIGLPGEPFVEYQLLAASLRPSKLVCVAGNGDIACGHICTRIAHAQGGYESDVSLVAPNSEEQIKAVLTSLANR